MAYAHVSRSKGARPSGATEDWKNPRYKLEKVFNTEEEIQVALDLHGEIKKSRVTCLECAELLILANHTGEKMDVLADLRRKGTRFGLSEKQQSFAADIMLLHMPKLLELIAAKAAGADTVEQVDLNECDGEVEVRLVPAAPKAPEDDVTAANPLLGMF